MKKNFETNEDQAKAIASATQPDLEEFTHVQGYVYFSFQSLLSNIINILLLLFLYLCYSPPETGKNKTILRIVSSLLAENKRRCNILVLVCVHLKMQQ